MSSTTRPGSCSPCSPSRPDATELARRYLRLGPSPRGAQALSLAGRAVALIGGRYNLAFDDVREVAFLGLRHRLILNFDAEREGITSDAIVADALERVPQEPR